MEMQSQYHFTSLLEPLTPDALQCLKRGVPLCPEFNRLSYGSFSLLNLVFQLHKILLSRFKLKTLLNPLLCLF
jgi:hypothetical protein